MNKQLLQRDYPDDWVVCPLSSFALDGNTNFVDGPFGSDLKVSDYTLSGVRILQLQNLGDGYYIDDNKIFTKEKRQRRYTDASQNQVISLLQKWLNRWLERL
jgi:type I restriction enzyme S subunit